MRSRSAVCVYDDSPAYPSQRYLERRQTAELDPGASAGEPIPVESEPSRASTVFSGSLAASAASSLTPASQPSTREVESTKSRGSYPNVSHRHDGTPRSVQSPAASVLNPDVDTRSSRIGGTFHFHRASTAAGQPEPMTCGVTHKTRMFGRSHWINAFALLRNLHEAEEPRLHEQLSRTFSVLQRCKLLASAIKSARAPAWPSPPTVELPEKAIADKLVCLYLQTFESVYRVLHVPSFMGDYEAVWISGAMADRAFVVQLKLVLALGAVMYDDRFSLRTQAIRWVYEAQTWISEPDFKPKLGERFLQINILLLLAREVVGVGGDSVWVSAGDLVRRAVSMGLHRDPGRVQPERTVLVSEMRRRLWSTVLEVALQSSLTSGGPPLISLDDFDTEAPGNFDDEELFTEDPAARPLETFTQTSIAISLRKTFPRRLAVARFLNNFGSKGGYEETLRLDAELRTSYKTVYRTLQGFRTNPTSSKFALHTVDFLMNRYLSSLHIPFFGPALHEASYAFSRNVVVETSLKIWCAAFPNSSVIAAQPRRDSLPPSSDGPTFSRLVTCGSGIFPTVAIQTVLLIAVEMKRQLQDDQGLGPVPVRADLLSVIADAKAWCVGCLDAGETNVKAHLLVSVLAAQIDALIQGQGEQNAHELMVQAAEESLTTSLSILERTAPQSQIGGSEEWRYPELENPTPEVSEDWGFLFSDALFNSESADPMNWMLNDEII